MRRMVEAGTPQVFATVSGEYDLIEIALCDELKDRHALPPVRGDTPGKRRCKPRRHRIGDASAAFLPGKQTAFRVAQEEPVVWRARLLDHQEMRVGGADEIVEIDLPGFQKLVHDRENEEPVGAGAERRSTRRRWRYSPCGPD